MSRLAGSGRRCSALRVGFGPCVAPDIATLRVVVAALAQW